MSNRKDDPSSNSQSLDALRDAALRCLDHCEALSAWAKSGDEAWAKGHQEGVLQAFMDGLSEAIEAGKGIEREPRLTLAPPCKFGIITARNAHMATLLLARKERRRILEAAATYGSLAAEEVRAVAYDIFGSGRSLPGFTPVRCDLGAWRETIAWEADRAAQAAPSFGMSAEQASGVKKNRKTQPRRAAKKTRNRRPRTVELLLVLLEDRTKANLNCTELAAELQVHVSSVSRAFKHKKYGPELLRRYHALGVRPPGIRHV
jgi:hypothetical protein